MKYTSYSKSPNKTSKKKYNLGGYIQNTDGTWRRAMPNEYDIAQPTLPADAVLVDTIQSNIGFGDWGADTQINYDKSNDLWGGEAKTLDVASTMTEDYSSSVPDSTVASTAPKGGNAMGTISAAGAGAELVGGTMVEHSKTDSGRPKAGMNVGGTALQYAGKGATIGATIGTAIGGPAGTVVGGAIGGAAGAIGGAAVGLSKQSKEKKAWEAQQAQKQKQQQSDLLNYRSRFQYKKGGMRNTENFYEFGGPAHEQGGIDIGNGDEVEKQETMAKIGTDDYIFSDTLTDSTGSTFAEQSKKINKKFGERTDSIARKTLEQKLGKLADENEKAKVTANNSLMYKNGGKRKYQVGGFTNWGGYTAPEGVDEQALLDWNQKYGDPNYDFGGKGYWGSKYQAWWDKYGTQMQGGIEKVQPQVVEPVATEVPEYDLKYNKEKYVAPSYAQEGEAITPYKTDVKDMYPGWGLGATSAIADLVLASRGPNYAKSRNISAPTVSYERARAEARRKGAENTAVAMRGSTAAPTSVAQQNLATQAALRNRQVTQDYVGKSLEQEANVNAQARFRADVINAQQQARVDEINAREEEALAMNRAQAFKNLGMFGQGVNADIRATKAQDKVINMLATESGYHFTNDKDGNPVLKKAKGAVSEDAKYVRFDTSDGKDVYINKSIDIVDKDGNKITDPKILKQIEKQLTKGQLDLVNSTK